MRVLRWIAGELLWIVAVLAGIAGAAFAFLATAYLTELIPVLAVAAVLSCFLLVTGIGALARRTGGRRARGSVVPEAALITVLVTVAGVVALSVPLTDERSQAQPREGVRYLDLSTGSRLAYYSFPGQAPVRPAPLVFLHGGPGGPLRSFEFDFFPQFTRDGYDVYLFEQAGVGASADLADIDDYTAARAVADLEALRVQIGAEQLTLVGQSWGGTLAALYLAAHPDRVARVAFTEPGGLPGEPGAPPPADAPGPGEESAPGDASDPLLPRFVAAALLAQINPDAAVNLVPPDELDSFFDGLVPGFVRQSFCRRDAARVPPVDVTGFNVYANLRINATVDQLEDPRPALRDSRVPALVMRGECSYIDWADTYAYKEAMPQALLVYVPNAGHVLWASQPTVTAEVIRSFLLDQPVPVPLYEGATDPAAG